MDEILIDDKKYISSKQAAKITGYAKDYVGQLCREGRVPARLVGRSWYVLEGAIQDHRFGGIAEDTAIDSAKAEKASIQSTWEAPRYEASPIETLPSIDKAEEVAEKDESKEVTTKDLQDSWQAWFSRMSEIHATEPEEAVKNTDNVESQEIGEQEEEVQDDEGENVEILIKPAYEVPKPVISQIIDTMPVSYGYTYDEPVKASKDFQARMSSRRNKVLSSIRISSLALAFVVIIICVIGTGYFDSYITSGNPVSLIAGVSFYNK